MRPLLLLIWITLALGWAGAEPTPAEAAEAEFLAESEKLSGAGGPRFRASFTTFQLKGSSDRQFVPLYLQRQNQYTVVVAGREGDSELQFTLLNDAGTWMPMHLSRRHGGGLYVLTIRPPGTGNYRLLISGGPGTFCTGYGYR